jgi:spore coat protein CotH
VTSGDRPRASVGARADNVVGTVDLWDESVLHEIEITYDKADYDRMIATFRSEGTKSYLEADITIDGTKLESVGLRLKGNSTLFALGGKPARAAGVQPGGVQGQPGGVQGQPGQLQPGVQPGGQTRPGAVQPGGVQPGGPPGSIVRPGGQLPGGQLPGAQVPGGGPQGGAIVGGAPSAVSVDEPEKLPWLIQFDEFVKNRRYQGQKEIAVRPSSGVTPNTTLNEALALQLIGMAAAPTERAAYSSFRVNGSKEVLRLVVEQPGDQFAGDNFEADGVLYKSLSSGTFSYLGEDPLAYDNAYRQITQKKQHDLAPLIKLLKWVSEADDAEFDANLDKYVDVTSLARYLALHNLLLDFDDMGGPGQNSYLWYDLDTERFTVVTWDVNLSLSGNVTQGPLDAGGAGGRGPGGLGNPLKTRFLASAKFQQVYLQEYRGVYDDLLTSGAALAALAKLEKVLTEEAASLVDKTTIASEVQRMRQTLTGRTEGLKTRL